MREDMPYRGSRVGGGAEGNLLSGISVAESDRSFPVRMAGRVLSDLGAEVWASAEGEDQDSSSEASTADAALECHLSAGKRLVADLGAEGPASFDIALATPGSRRRVSASITSIISPFGLVGPKSAFLASELVIANAGGMGYLAPRTDPGDQEDAGEREPLWYASDVIHSYGGLHAAAAALVWLHAASARKDQDVSCELDISLQDAMVPMLRRELAVYQFTGTVPDRRDESWLIAPHGIRRTRDGWIRLHITEDYHWVDFANVIGHPELASDPRYATAPERFANQISLEPIIAEWLKKKTTLGVFESCQLAGLPIAPCFSYVDLLKLEQLQVREFFRVARNSDGQTLPILGSPIHVGGKSIGASTRTGSVGRYEMADESIGRWETDGAEPQLPDAWRDKPLAGVRVLDFGHVWAAPYAAQLLAMAGAEVIKVESKRHIDPLRHHGPYQGKESVNTAGVWNMQNSCKQSVTINLAVPEGAELALELVRCSDAGLANFTPGVMDRLGLGYEAMKSRNPAFVMVQVSGFGATGPFRTFKALGSTMEAAGGLCSIIGYPGGPPLSVAGGLPDTSAALYVVMALMAALSARRRTGVGTNIELSQLESVLSLSPQEILSSAVTGEAPGRQGNDRAGIAPNGVYRCAGDDEWIAISVETDVQWRALRELAAVPDLYAADLESADQRSRQRARLDQLITGWTANHKAAVLADLLQRRGVAASKSNSVQDLLDDRHLNARQLFATLEHREMGPSRVYRSPWSVVGRHRPAPDAAPLLGQDTEAVLSTVIGLSDSEIADLIRRGVLY